MIDGLANTIVKKDHIEEMYQRRLTICMQCDKRSRRNTCKLCGCFLGTKLRAPYSHCPLLKWLPEPL